MHELASLLCFFEDAMFTKKSDVIGDACTKEIELHWMCRDQHLIRYISNEYFAPLLSKSRKTGGGCKCSLRIVVHRTGPLAKEDAPTQSILWNSYIGSHGLPEYKADGPTDLAYDQLSAFGRAWVPTRFSTGTRVSLASNIPSFLVFSLIGYISIWLVLRAFIKIDSHYYTDYPVVYIHQRIWYFLTPIFVGLFISYMAHVIMDCFDSNEEYDSIQEDSSEDSANERSSNDDENSSYKIDNALDDGDNEKGRQAVSLVDLKGRPTSEDLISCARDAESCGIFLCGTKSMIDGVKRAAGLKYINVGARLQAFANGKKFAFYEEKFEW